MIRLFQDPEWQRFPYILSLLADAYTAANNRTRARNFRWRSSSTRSAWQSPPLPVRASATPREAIRVTLPEGDTSETPEPAEAMPQEPATEHLADPAESASGPRGYTLQVGAFGNESNALRLQEHLRGKGFEVTIRRTGSLHRVWVGHYASRDEAKADIPNVSQHVDTTPVITRNR